jgi:hypothetical protein
MTRPLVALLLLPLTLALSSLGCDDDGAPAAVTTAQVAMACTGPDDDPVNDIAAVSIVEMCNYWRDSRGFHVKLIAPPPADAPDYNEININIANLTGPGTYVTDPAGATEVAVVGGGGFGVDSSGDTATDDSPAFAVDTNLHAVAIPAGDATTGWISLDVTCPQLGTAQIGRMTCDLSPQSFHLVIADCEAGH